MTNLIFKDEDFRGLPFPIHKADPSQSILTQIPDLLNVPQFAAAVSNTHVDQIIKYIILMYSKQSPLAKKFTDLTIRKTQAAIMAGFDMVEDLKGSIDFIAGEGEDDEDIELVIPSLLTKLYDFLDEQMSEMIVGFLRFQNDLRYSMLESNRQTFYEYQQTLLSPVLMIRNDKDRITALAVKSKLMEDSDAIALRIEKYEQEVYVDPKAIDHVRKRRSSPESIAAD